MRDLETRKTLLDSVINTNCLRLLGLGLLLSGSLANAQSMSLKDLEAACENNKAEQCIDAGTAYARGELQGKKVKKDKLKSQRLIKRGTRLGEQSCNRGNARDCYVLGIVYFEGEIISADFPRGLDMLQRSCSGGYQEACTWLENSGIHFTIE